MAPNSPDDNEQYLPLLILGELAELELKRIQREKEEKSKLNETEIDKKIIYSNNLDKSCISNISDISEPISWKKSKMSEEKTELKKSIHLLIDRNSIQSSIDRNSIKSSIDNDTSTDIIKYGRRAPYEYLNINDKELDPSLKYEVILKNQIEILCWRENNKLFTKINGFKVLLESKKIFFCNEKSCKATALSLSKIQRHKKTHQNIKNIKCLSPMCRKTFLRKDNMMCHFRNTCRFNRKK